MKRTQQAGFTLVEVLTVIAIIALLAALILGLAGNAQKKAARSRAEAEIEQLSTFVIDYQTKYGQVPTKSVLSNELKKASHSLSNMIDPWGMTYEYTNSSRATFYLWSRGGSTNASAKNDNRAMYIGNPAP